ncbi:MAG: ribosome maturation factor RimM [Lachnospiraceae bacterium]|nr:ribosome maturation factor RimM [Lachnospiraceae bacterium]
MEQRFRIGEIANTHGIRGEVKVYPTTDDVARFKKLKKCILETKQGEMLLHVESCKFFKQFAILKFKEFNNINEVEQYKHCSLYVEREDAVKCEEDEYYIADLVGCTVYNEDDSELGDLIDVIQTGANDVYVVRMESGKELMIPAIKECILSVSITERRVKVHLLKGLLDL